MHIPSYLKPRFRTTAFHVRGLSVRHADWLWDAGFQEVDELDDQGQTSLMLTSDSALGAWLIRKGADPRKRHCGGLWTAAHYLGRKVYNSSDVYEQFMPVLQEFGLFEETVSLRDDCQCACSLSGCTLLSNLVGQNIKMWWEERPLGSRILALRNELGPLDSFTTQHDPRTLIGKNLWEAALRALAFYMLGLTHTCCYISRFARILCSLRSQDETTEIREEEAESIQRLEKMLAEAFAKQELSNPSHPFCSFIDFFYERINQESEDGKDKNDYIRRLREMGVIVYDEE